jgi:hypothetical protein
MEGLKWEVKDGLVSPCCEVHVGLWDGMTPDETNILVGHLHDAFRPFPRS